MKFYYLPGRKAFKKMHIVCILDENQVDNGELWKS